MVDVLRFTEVSCPLGVLTLAEHDGTVVALWFGPLQGADLESLRARLGRPKEQSVHRSDAASALAAYFDGDLGALDNIDVDPGGTPFQRRVWERLRRIPPGETRSYTRLAREVGSASSVRAVGAANGANPIAIVVPCHRVIGADGRLVGYGGGLDRKRWLLAHEGVRTGDLFASGT
jgi:methylated-DNA-[protein]-cysteine S-methyltransferase